LKGQTMRVYTRRHVFSSDVRHIRGKRVRTRTVHVCLDTHELCVSVRLSCFQGPPTPTPCAACSPLLSSGREQTAVLLWALPYGRRTPA